jgi:ATP-dependent 26S proteasome regulatory subunit
MKAEINDLSQFFRFCQIQNCLISIAEQNHQILYKDISKLIKENKKIISKSIKTKSPLKEFCNYNNLKIVDLDLLNIALSEQIRSITIEQYLEKSIFEPYNKALTNQILNKLKKANLIKNNLLTIENPFQENQNNINQNKPEKKVVSRNIINLLNTKLAKKRSNKKLKIEFSTKPYLKLDSILKEIYFLDKILNINIENNKGLNKENLDFIYNAYLKKVQESYKKTIKEKNKDFSKFLSEHNIKLNELLLIIKSLTQTNEYNQSSIRISEELYSKFKNYQSIERLLKNEILKKEWGFFELTPKAIKGLLNINSDNECKYNIVITEKPTQTFDKVCLNNNIKKQIINSINQYKNRDLIFNKWGLKDSIGYGKGITLNFSGPPGTGKTLSVKAIANYLNKKLLTINYSQIKSCYLGETEKNIRNAFKIAKKEDAVLFFDEADSLTTKRENSIASWEISITNTLLKELEEYDGICIFATNFAGNYDEAFNRRLSAHIEFKLPDKNQLKQILEIHFPKKEALAKDINFLDIVEEYEGIFSGGDIKNIVLNTARIAADDEKNKNKLINQEHILEACNIVLNSKKNIVCFSDNKLDYFG